MTNIAETTQDYRAEIAGRYLRGVGVEIGALDAPFPVPAYAHVKYVDRLPKTELLKQYPELSPRAALIVEPDIIDNGETLVTVREKSQDFVIMSHFLEHTQNPLGTLRTVFSKLKPGASVIIAVPNSAHPESWDANRPLTTFEHLMRDDMDGPEWSRETHFKEWCTFAGKMTDPGAIDAEARKLMQQDYSIHFHCWTKDTFAAFLSRSGG